MKENLSPKEQAKLQRLAKILGNDEKQIEHSFPLDILYSRK